MESINISNNLIYLNPEILQTCGLYSGVIWSQVAMLKVAGPKDEGYISISDEEWWTLTGISKRELSIGFKKLSENGLIEYRQKVINKERFHQFKLKGEN